MYVCPLVFIFILADSVISLMQAAVDFCQIRRSAANGEWVLSEEGCSVVFIYCIYLYLEAYMYLCICKRK